MKTRIEGLVLLLTSMVALYLLVGLRHVSPGHEVTLAEFVTGLTAVVMGVCGSAMAVVGKTLFLHDEWPPRSPN